MTAVPHPHELLLEQVQKEFAEIFARSSQGVYIYLDDPHSIFSDRLATMLGYASAQEVADSASSSSFLEALVVPGSRQAVVEAYRKAVDAKAASSIPVTWQKKGGGTLGTQTMFVPLSFRGTMLVLHFVTPI